jgi:hypothetical protein
MSISRVTTAGPHYSHSYTSSHRDERSLLEDLQMSCECFVSVEEVAGNHLTSSIAEGVYYLAMAKPDVTDLGPPLVSRINGYKHLISRIWLAKATSQALVYFPLQDSVITIIHRV